jgi:hypothetical protein
VGGGSAEGGAWRNHLDPDFQEGANELIAELVGERVLPDGASKEGVADA